MVNLGTSLVVQCLGVHLPIKGAGVPVLVRGDPKGSYITGCMGLDNLALNERD